MKPTHYGYSSDDWQKLVRLGAAFLLEQGRLGRIPDYTLLCKVISNRASDKDREVRFEPDRLALPALLRGIEDLSPLPQGVMLTAIVQRLNRNEPGNGFYVLAANLGLIPRGLSAAEKYSFWVAQVAAVHRALGGGERNVA